MAESDVAMPGAGHLFLKPATPPSYLHCANAPTCTTIEYKSGTRAHIASEGYRIVADFGDQYSDLLGGHAGHQVKIPTRCTTSPDRYLVRRKPATPVAGLRPQAVHVRPQAGAALEGSRAAE